MPREGREDRSLLGKGTLSRAPGHPLHRMQGVHAGVCCGGAVLPVLPCPATVSLGVWGFGFGVVLG